MTWQKVDDSLGGSCSDNLWSDHMFEEVAALMQELTPAEFASVRFTWPRRSLEWQTRCAEVLPWAPAPRQEVVSVLLEMVEFADDELTITAADVLREFDPATVAAMMTPATVGRLLEIAGRNPGLSARAIQRLLDSLPMGRRP